LNKPKSFLERDISRKTRYFVDSVATLLDQDQQIDL